MAAISATVPLAPVVETVTISGCVLGPRSVLPLNGSPVLVQNILPWRIMLLVTGGNVSLVEFSRDAQVFDTMGMLMGQFFLNPGDWLRITYLVAPTVVYYPF